jgi:hypothetical protein
VLSPTRLQDPCQCGDGVRGVASATVASMALAQSVGLFKAEATIRLTQSISDPLWLRFWVYLVLGAALTFAVAYTNVRLIQWLSKGE